MVRRINVNSFTSPDDLVAMLDQSKEKMIEYDDDFTSNNGWLKGWGSMEINNGMTLAGGSPSEDSGLTFLNGSYLWKDYTATTKLRTQKVDAFALIARYKDGGSFVSCDFSNNQVALGQRVSDHELETIEAPVAFQFDPEKDTEVGISVVQDRAGCILNGQTIISATINRNLDQGGIGYKIWNSTDMNSVLKISSLKVTPPTFSSISR